MVFRSKGTLVCIYISGQRIPTKDHDTLKIVSVVT